MAAGRYANWCGCSAQCWQHCDAATPHRGGPTWRLRGGPRWPYPVALAPTPCPHYCRFDRTTAGRWLRWDWQCPGPPARLPARAARRAGPRLEVWTIGAESSSRASRAEPRALEEERPTPSSSSRQVCTVQGGHGARRHGQGLAGTHAVPPYRPHGDGEPPAFPRRAGRRAERATGRLRGHRARGVAPAASARSSASRAGAGYRWRGLLQRESLRTERNSGVGRASLSRCCCVCRCRGDAVLQ